MRHTIIFDTNCLSIDDIKFYKRYEEKLKGAWKNALSVIKDQNSLQTLKTIYIIPDYFKVYFQGYNRWVYIQYGSDPFEEDSAAIIISLGFIVDFTQNNISCALVHELKHHYEDVLLTHEEKSARALLFQKNIKEFDKKAHETKLNLKQYISNRGFQMIKSFDFIANSSSFPQNFPSIFSFINITNPSDVFTYMIEKRKSHPRAE